MVVVAELMGAAAMLVAISPAVVVLVTVATRGGTGILVLSLRRVNMHTAMRVRRESDGLRIGMGGAVFRFRFGHAVPLLSWSRGDAL